MQHVLGNPKSYPGPHNVSQERTSKGLQKLDPARQLTLIWDAASTRLGELLMQGYSVSIPGFGVFSFENVLRQQKFGPNQVSRVPRFAPADGLLKACSKYHGKDELGADPDAITVAQAVPSRVMFLNEVPIASGCYYPIEVVKSSLKNIFGAITDLAERGYELDLQMGVARFRVKNSSMKTEFDPTFMAKMGTLTKPKNNPAGEQEAKLSDTWKKASYSKAMASFIDAPDVQNVHAIRIATGNLQVMSKDLTTCK